MRLLVQCELKKAPYSFQLCARDHVFIGQLSYFRAGRYFILWDIVDPRTESNPNPNPEPNPHPNPEPNSNHNPNPDPNCGLYPIR